MAATPNTPIAQAATPPRRGAQRGNRNAMRHGIETTQLPKSDQKVDQKKDEFRRGLEDAVAAATGAVDAKAAGHIAAATLRYRNVKLRGRYLRNLAVEGKRNTKEWFDHSDKQADDMEKIADRIAKLPLDRDDKQNIVDALYARVVPAVTNGNSQEQPEAPPA